MLFLFVFLFIELWKWSYRLYILANQRDHVNDLAKYVECLVTQRKQLSFLSFFCSKKRKCVDVFFYVSVYLSCVLCGDV